MRVWGGQAQLSMQTNPNKTCRNIRTIKNQKTYRSRRDRDEKLLIRFTVLTSLGITQCLNNNLLNIKLKCISASIM